jgi:hypothetical protein
MRKHLLLLSPFLMAVAFPARGLEFKTAARLFLSSGDVVEDICTSTGSQGANGTTLTARFSSGIVVTVSSKVDFVRKHGDTRISDGKTVLEIHDDYGYYRDNLPVPLQVKIGEDVYRVLLKPNTLTDDQKRMQTAVAKLPAPFLTALQKLVPIARVAECTIANLAMVSELCDVTLPKASIITVEKLKPDEIDALVRDAVK